MSTCMENTDWDFVLQFVSEPLDMEFSHVPERPVAERTHSAVPVQVPTPPVRGLDLKNDVRQMILTTNLQRTRSAPHRLTHQQRKTHLSLCLPLSFLEHTFTHTRQISCCCHPTPYSFTFTRACCLGCLKTTLAVYYRRRPKRRPAN